MAVFLAEISLNDDQELNLEWLPMTLNQYLMTFLWGGVQFKCNLLLLIWHALGNQSFLATIQSDLSSIDRPMTPNLNDCIHFPLVPVDSPRVWLLQQPLQLGVLPVNDN